MDLNVFSAQANPYDYCNYLFSLMYWNYDSQTYKFNIYNVDLDLPYDFDPLLAYLNRPALLSEIQADHFAVFVQQDVFDSLIPLDWTADASLRLTALLDAGVRVLGFNGDLDLICNFVSGELWTSGTPWKHQADFNGIKEYTIKDFGLAKVYANFAYVVIKDAGHMSPHDKPQETRLMLDWFVNGFV